MGLLTKKKKLGIMFLIILAIIVYLGFRFLVKPQPPASSIPPSVQLLESRLIGRKDGARQWEILAKSVLQADDLITLSEIKEITIFQEEKPYLFVQADGATWQRKKDILNLKGSVVVEDFDDFRLESDFLVWRGEESTLTSPGSAIIYWNGLQIKADQMVLKTESNLLYLQDNVEIQDGQFIWRLQQAVYDLDQELVDFYGGLVLETEVSEDHGKE